MFIDTKMVDSEGNEIGATELLKFMENLEESQYEYTLQKDRPIDSVTIAIKKYRRSVLDLDKDEVASNNKDLEVKIEFLTMAGNRRAMRGNELLPEQNVVVDLVDLDRFSQAQYKDLVGEIKKRRHNSSKRTRIKEMVSRNRMRYNDGKYNLDLSYITPRVIAMGLPARGFHTLFRNSQNTVLQFFEEYHDYNLKIYNMCNDNFVDTKLLTLADGRVRLAYFPFMDHNPGPL